MQPYHPFENNNLIKSYSELWNYLTTHFVLKTYIGWPFIDSYFLPFSPLLNSLHTLVFFRFFKYVFPLQFNVLFSLWKIFYTNLGLATSVSSFDYTYVYGRVPLMSTKVNQLTSIQNKKLAKSRWLQTVKIYCLTVLKARCLKPRYLVGPLSAWQL